MRKKERSFVMDLVGKRLIGNSSAIKTLSSGRLMMDIMWSRDQSHFHVSRLYSFK